MSYYNNYRGQRTGQRSYNSPQPPKRLLPEKLHEVFRIELNRLNNDREIISENGSLFDSDIASSSSDNTSINNNANDTTSTSIIDKYPLQSVYIGEVWRFRVKISNKLSENLHNFGLLCHIEMNLKGNGNPKQLYPRPRELCPTTMNKHDNISIDLEYPFISNEPSSYSLIFTITASNEDDMQRLYKDIFEFNAVPALSLTFQKQTLDENLFVEALINNVSNQPSLPLYVQVNFKCLGLFKSYNLTNYYNNNNNNNKGKYNDNSIHLQPSQETNVLFQIEMKNPTSLVNLNALSVGQIEIKWKCDKLYGFREGIFLSDIIQRRSLFCRKLDSDKLSGQPSENIEILILKCPSSCVVHQEFMVQFHIFNLDRYSHKIWLSIDKNLSGYLLPCNISKKYLGILEPSSSMKTDMTLIAFAPGIHVLTGIVITTQKLNTIKPNQQIKKTIHYESQQYIYIDIDPQFHAKKIKEKYLREQKEKKEEIITDMDEIKIDNTQIEIEIQNEIETEIEIETEQKQKQIQEKQNKEIKQIKQIQQKEIQQIKEIQQQTRHRGSISIEQKVDIETKLDIETQTKIETVNDDQIEIQNAEIEIETESEQKIPFEQFDAENELNIEPSPKHKPSIPPSSSLKPIGHQKSEDEILKEQQEEKKKEIQSLKPLKSLDTDTDIDLNEEDKVIDDGLNIEDEFDVKPYEIGGGNDDEKKNDEVKEEQIDIRDLGAKDANSSAISVVFSGPSPIPSGGGVVEENVNDDNNNNDNNNNDNNNNNNNDAGNLNMLDENTETDDKL